MSESRILSAFYQPKAKRFVPLTGDEIRERSGLPAGHPNSRSLIARGIITRTKLQGMNASEWLYSLSREGEARVTAMVVTGTLPKPVLRLTATPPNHKRTQEAAK